MNAPFHAHIVHGLPIEHYHGMTDFISKTGLDRIERSPAYYYATTLDPNRPPEKERAGQLEGNLAHCAILELDEFIKRYAVLPIDAPRKPTEAQWNAKKPSPDSIAAMEWWTKWNADNTGKTIITAQQYGTAMRQRDQVMLLPDVAEALARGHAEVSAFWSDQQTGVLCRCRPDWVHPVGDDAVILLDVKTYSDASPDEFARQCARKAYHKQAAYYSDGFEAASGKRVLAFIFVAVETDWPNAASATMLDEQAIEQGRADYRRNLQTYAQCLKTGQWPGYSTGIETVSLPRWALTDVEIY